MVQQSTKLALLLAGALALGLAGMAQADDPGSVESKGTAIKSRGADAAHADLMRDWNYKGGDRGRSITLRTDSQLNADLMRDWGGPGKAGAVQTRKTPHSRSVESAYDDLMRNWGG